MKHKGQPYLHIWLSTFHPIQKSNSAFAPLEKRTVFHNDAHYRGLLALHMQQQVLFSPGTPGGGCCDENQVTLLFLYASVAGTKTPLALGLPSRIECEVRASSSAELLQVPYTYLASNIDTCLHNVSLLLILPTCKCSSGLTLTKNTTSGVQL